MNDLPVGTPCNTREVFAGTTMDLDYLDRYQNPWPYTLLDTRLQQRTCDNFMPIVNGDASPSSCLRNFRPSMQNLNRHNTERLTIRNDIWPEQSPKFSNNNIDEFNLHDSAAQSPYLMNLGDYIDSPYNLKILSTDSNDNPSQQRTHNADDHFQFSGECEASEADSMALSVLDPISHDQTGLLDRSQHQLHQPISLQQGQGHNSKDRFRQTETGKIFERQGHSMESKEIRHRKFQPSSDWEFCSMQNSPNAPHLLKDLADSKFILSNDHSISADLESGFQSPGTKSVVPFEKQEQHQNASKVAKVERDGSRAESHSLQNSHGHEPDCLNSSLDDVIMKWQNPCARQEAKILCLSDLLKVSLLTHVFSAKLVRHETHCIRRLRQQVSWDL